MKHRKLFFYLCIALLILVAAAFFYFFRRKIGRILSPFFISVLLTYLVKPIAEKLAARKIPMSLSVIAVYLAFILAIAAVGIFFVPELTTNMRELMNTLPDFMASYEKMFNDMLSAIKSSKWSDDIKLLIFTQIENGTAALQKFIFGMLENWLSYVVDTVKIIFDLTVAMVITYYIIKDADKFRDFTLSLVPRKWRNGLVGTGREINKVLSNFIQGQLLTALIVGLLETMGLMIVNIKYPLVLGMVGGLANIIPYFGPYIGAVPTLAVAFTMSPMKAVWALVVFLLVQQIDNNFISPKMIEGKIGLHPVVTIFAVLAGGEFFGILGMLLAVPVMAILRIIVNKAVEAIA